MIYIPVKADSGWDYDYDYDYDDGYDSTYAYFEFTVPDKYTQTCKILAPKEDRLSVGEMFKKGYVQKGLKPVYWCADCETALAEAVIVSSLIVLPPIIGNSGSSSSTISS